jgi:hypothetical protein
MSDDRKIIFAILGACTAYLLLVLCAFPLAIVPKKPPTRSPEISNEVKQWVEMVQMDYLKDSLLGDFVQDKIDAEMYKTSRLFLTKCERDGTKIPSTYTLDGGVVVFDWNGLTFKRME